MRLDHLSYVSTHSQISETVNRIGSQIKTAFVDGGVHPKFGTRNFTAPLLNGQYIEIVCPMEHPATDSTPFGRAVKQKAESGGGWLTWVIATKDLSHIENKLGRKAVLGNRKRPNGLELQWKQIGVLNTLEDYQTPFFIQWISGDHPSVEGRAVSSISKIEILGSDSSIKKIFDINIDYGNADIVWSPPNTDNEETGISSVNFKVEDSYIEVI